MENPPLSNHEALTEFVKLVVQAEDLKKVAVDYHVSFLQHTQWGDYFRLTVSDVLFPGSLGNGDTTKTLTIFLEDPCQDFLLPKEKGIALMRDFLQGIKSEQSNRHRLLERKEELLSNLSPEDRKLLGLPLAG